MKPTRLAAIVVASLLPVTALAADDWTGAYAGLQFGTLSAMQDVNNVSTTAGVVRSWSPDPDGASGGIFLGYNWQHGMSLVYGVEAELNWSGANGRSGVTTPATGPGGGTLVEVVETRVSRTAALRGRIGYALNATLLYATAGLAWIDHDGVYRGTFTTGAGVPVGSTPQPWSDTARGWTAGIGVEQEFGGRWVGRIDYRYTDLGGLFYRPVGPTGGTNNFLGDLRTHAVRVGIAMRF
jgi:outer membrane immunogenic protein